MPSRNEGPKGIALADFDGDARPDIAIANLDGTVTVYFSLGEGRFSPAKHLRAFPRNTVPAGIGGGGPPPLPEPPTRLTNELRGIVCADFTGDGRPDIATAAPYVGQVYMFINQGLRAFSSVTNVPAWIGARNLAAGDFDGDGMVDFVVGGTTNGIRQYRNLGGFNFEVKTNLITLAANYEDEEDAEGDFPRPVYAMSVFRVPGTSRDQLAVTHVDSEVVWRLSANTNGVLEIVGTLANQLVHSLLVGPATQPIANGVFDLITAHRDLGSVQIHPADLSAVGFDGDPVQVLNIPGGPRALALTDLDGDGWNDLVVVVRNFDRVIGYHNSNGVFVANSEIPVGNSPRELVVADFNGDATPDLAVMNRDSRDVSIVMTFPGQSSFVTSDQIYRVDGEIAGLTVQDFDGNGRDDVIQLHRASGEISVRLSDPTGRLGAPTIYNIGLRPEAQTIADFNGDGIPDIATANLSGTISVRLGIGAGMFGEERVYTLPPDARGGLFALVGADFDSDGHIDLAAGYYDCRLAFFRGDGDGNFTFTHNHLFVYEARAMAAGDFDQDGDIDLAGGGMYGTLLIVENLGDLLTTSTLARTEYPSPRLRGARSVKVLDDDSDGDPDIIVGADAGVVLYRGGAGVSFTEVTSGASFPNLNFSASSVLFVDLDGDTIPELVTGCQLVSCLVISTRDTNGVYLPSLTVDVPAARYLASGDLDGDGLPDLVGSGNVLWTALSSRPPQPVAAMVEESPRVASSGPVINEVLALNTDFPLELDGGRTPDWVELYNGSQEGNSLNGWSLRLESISAGVATTNNFVFPPTAFFGSGAHLLVVFSETRRSPYHTGFKLPAEGGSLVLINPDGVEVNRVAYPEQQDNVSYGRYRDGAAAFSFNGYPDPGRANTDNGPLEPTLSLTGIDPATLKSGDPIRFFATGADEAGIVSVNLVCQRLDITNAEPFRVFLFDDGMNGDGGRLDGLFSGVLTNPLPFGAEIQFYVEVVDLSDKVITMPGDATFAEPGEPLRLYTMTIGPSAAPLEISELVAFNTTGLVDERGTNSDWVEIRNVSGSPVSLNGVTLAENLFGSRNRYSFPAGTVLAPREHVIVYCDNGTSVSPAHAPFALSREGGSLVLTGVAGGGARNFIDQVTFASQRSDIAYARLGQGGDFREVAPTPRAPNVSGPWLAVKGGDGFTFAFPTLPGNVYTVQQTVSLANPRWSSLPPIAGDGLEKSVTLPFIQQRYFRVRRD